LNAPDLLSASHLQPPADAHAAAVDMGLAFDNRYARLPGAFHSRVAATPLPQPYPVARSDAAARLLGLAPERLAQPDAIAVLAGNRLPAGGEPVATVYSGHQFGVYVPRLGDGRALLLGEVVAPDGTRWELQLKGSGQTPYSRMGDGRAVLRSSIREFLASEAMHALGIPTTRALAIVGADMPVIRETVETAAVVTRLAPSFIRFGTFEYFYWTQQHDALRRLADFVIDHFYPELRAAPQPYLALLEQVARRTARLVAQWQGVGFCHGVLNTDNMSILGLTLDYGPFGFMDAFDANHVCNHSDELGRYAYAMQPDIGHWNLYALGQALIPLTEDVDATRAAIDTYRDEFDRALAGVFGAKLGLVTQQAGDDTLLRDLLALLQANHTDWTRFWRALGRLPDAPDTAGDAAVRDLVADREALDAWIVRYRARLAAEGSVATERRVRMDRANPLVVLRNHLAEAAIRLARGEHAAGAGPRDYGEIARLLAVLQHPYDDGPEHARYAAEPPAWAQSLHLSCSS